MLSGAAVEASAQTLTPAAWVATREASTVAGRFQGLVHDEAGLGVGGASIFAAGSSVAIATTDVTGRFHLDLPPGPYLVRAERAGYVSTYREVVNVRAYASLERRIRLVKAEDAAVQPAPGAPAPVTPADAEVGRGAVAWRLRHLTRTVLRDTSPAAVPAETEPARTLRAKPFDMSSLFDRTVQGSARLASSFFGKTDFRGQLNLFTLRAGSVPGAVTDVDGSRGIADVIIGAPVGTIGDWSVRGAMLAGDASSWTLLGEYQARDGQRHPLHVAIAYSTQGYAAGRDLPMSMVVPESRSAGGIRLSDQWQLAPSIALDYGLRYDRHDYLSEPDLVSPSAGVRVEVFDKTFVVASTAQRMIAPGADEFQPPAATGPWLPPTRTFSSLSSRRGLEPERVRRHSAGIEHAPRGSQRAVVGVEWFSSQTIDALATLYGLDEASEAGHYYVASAGDVAVMGWKAHASARVSENVQAAIEYASGDARWSPTKLAGALRRSAPELARRGRDRVSDLKASADVTMPRTSTRIAIVYRLNRAERRESGMATDRIGDGRFHLEVAQRLPYQPIGAGLLNLLFTFRTFVHDEDGGSLYDEVLTLRPPTRLTGGLQVRF